MSAATRSPASGSRTARVTSAPAAASARAVSTPMPEAPPVTIARRPGQVDARDHVGGRGGPVEGGGDAGGWSVSVMQPSGTRVGRSQSRTDPGDSGARLGATRLAFIVGRCERGANLIGEYLRARRELVRPEDGRPARVFGRRRVPGPAPRGGRAAGRHQRGLLRAPRAGPGHAARRSWCSTPSHGHCSSTRTRRRTCAGSASRASGRAAPRAAPERVSPGIASLIASWGLTPAFVHGRYMDVLACNALAAALVPCCRPGANLVRACFLDPPCPSCSATGSRAPPGRSPGCGRSQVRTSTSRS